MFNLNCNSCAKKDICAKFAVAVRLYLLSKLIVRPGLYITYYSTPPKPAKLSDFDIQHKTPVVRKQSQIPIAYYGGRHAATQLPGSGIGPECMCHVKTVFK